MKIISIFILLWFTWLDVFSQRVGGYYPNYAYTAANAQNIQYDKLTHLYYFALNPRITSPAPTDGNLWLNDSFSWFTTARFTDVINRARTKNPNIKIIITTGGAPGSDNTLNQRFEHIGNNPAINTRFCNSIISFIKQYDLNGWDFDWEYPNTNSSRNAHQNILALMRTKIDSLKIAECKNYEISIAVGGGYYNASCWNPTHLSYLNNAVINSVDYVNVMTYDGPVGSAPCGFTSHVQYEMYTASFNTWKNSKSWPSNKFMLGVGFYDNNGQLWRNNATAGNYNSNYWGTGGGGCLNIQNKIDFNAANGVAGIFTWELTQDNLCSGTVPTCYSLLDCMYQKTITKTGIWTPSSGSPCITPVKLVYFDINTGNNGENNVIWSSASEIGFSHYEIQFSTNGIDFSTLRSVKGRGDENRATFYSEEITLQNGYIRLKMVDQDGTIEYSESKSINQSFVPKTTIYPNPFGNQITVIPAQRGDTEVSIFNIMGKCVYKNHFELLNDGAIEVPTETFQRGKYILRLATSNKTDLFQLDKY